jgi:DNA-binding transcriptional regulator YhcF (GntR family)
VYLCIDHENLIYTYYITYITGESMLTITVNYDTAIPLYAQVYNRIVEEINSNHIHYGNNIPSPGLIATVLGMDLQMVEKSFRLLSENRIIARLKTKKYVVSGSPDNETMEQIRIKNN